MGKKVVVSQKINDNITSFIIRCQDGTKTLDTKEVSDRDEAMQYAKKSKYSCQFEGVLA